MDLLSIDDLSDAQIAQILERGERWFELNRSDTQGRDKPLTGKLVFNRTITLKDTWAKEVKKR